MDMNKEKKRLEMTIRAASEKRMVRNSKRDLGLKKKNRERI